jgi:hypothetical protein
VRGCALSSFQNLRKDTFDVCHYVVVPKAKHGDPSRLQYPGPIFVSFDLACMLAAIELNDEVSAFAEKIGVEPKERNLAPELQAVKLAVPKVLPEHPFSLGAFAAQLASPACLLSHLVLHSS